MLGRFPRLARLASSEEEARWTSTLPSAPSAANPNARGGVSHGTAHSTPLVHRSSVFKGAPAAPSFAGVRLGVGPSSLMGAPLCRGLPFEDCGVRTRTAATVDVVLAHVWPPVQPQPPL